MVTTEWCQVQDVLAGMPADRPVRLRGWVYRTRSSGNIVFMTLRDVSGVIQVTVKKGNLPDPQFEAAKSALIESSVELGGEVKVDPRAPGGYEILARSVNVVNFAEPFPITKDQSPEFLLDQRHLWLRSRLLTATLKIRSTVIGAIHQFFRDRGFYEFDAPVLQPNQCEGGSTLFEVKYYQDKTYLSQSWQLYAEAGVFALEKIYNVGPTFRAERSKTSRHLSEFWMAEMEAAWMDLQDITEIAKDEIRFIIGQVLEKNASDLKVLDCDPERLHRLATAPYPTITYTDALEVLRQKEGKEVEWGKDLRTTEEDSIMKHFETPVVVTNYPLDIMAFYKPPDPKDPKTALCFDMLAPDGYGEIIGGSQRSTDIAYMSERLRQMGEKVENYQWYFDLRRYGSVPHAGYGLGVERVVAWICHSENIKETIPFPRTLLRFRP